jgi:hypothetical protein
MPKTKAPAVIEPAFTVVEQRWGTFTSVDSDGNQLVTSLSEQGCREATDFYLKGKQEGEFTGPETAYDGLVTGKL